MFRSATPIAYFQQQIHILQLHVPGVLDGRRDSIHDARIATRRIREVLPLTHEWQRRHVANDLFTRIKQIGRSLGKVRDADARIQLLRYLESRAPHAVASLVLVRRRQERDRLVLVRKLIRRFERLSVGRELARLSTASAWQGFRIALNGAGAWRHQLRHLVAERARSANEAIVHSTGVYFPKRSHEARIAIKKFRYAVEISAYSGLLTNQSLMRALRKTQDLLGEIHDRQTLIDDLTDHGAAQAGIDAGQIDLVVRLAEVEIEDLHGRLLVRRPELLEACGRAQHTVRGPELPIAALSVAGAVALATALEARRRRVNAAAPVKRDHLAPEVSVRIPVTLQTATK